MLASMEAVQDILDGRRAKICENAWCQRGGRFQPQGRTVDGEQGLLAQVCAAVPLILPVAAMPDAAISRARARRGSRATHDGDADCVWRAEIENAEGVILCNDLLSEAALRHCVT